MAAVLAVLVSAASWAADHFTGTSEWFGVVAVVALGGALSLVAGLWLSPAHPPRAHSKLLHRLFVGLLVTTTVISTAMVWPGPASPRAQRNSTTGPTAEGDPKSSADPTKGLHVTKVGAHAPTTEGLEVAHCLTVSGVGEMPEGYWLWVANNFDRDGEPEAGSYNSMQRAMQTEGRARWATPEFGVGKRENKEQIIWIHVFLLPEATDERLKRVHGGAWGISGSYPGTEPIAAYKVRQDGTGDC